MQELKRSAKPLPASMRIKKRYLLMRLISDRQFSPKDVLFALRSHLLSMLGSISLGKAYFSLISYNALTGHAIIRCSRQMLPKIRASLVLFNNINQNKVSVRLLRVSGTLKTLKEVKHSH